MKEGNILDRSFEALFIDFDLFKKNSVIMQKSIDQ
jgi:lipoprotein signal peptidase